MAAESLQRVQRLLEPYQRLDPSGWVELYRAIPVPLGVVAMALGLALVWRGNGLLYRVVAIPLGGLLGLIWTAPLLARFSIAGNPAQLTALAALALAVLGFAWPPAVTFVAAGLPSGLACGQLANPADWTLAFSGGFALGGAVGLGFQPVLASIISSLLGAWLITVGALATMAPYASSVGTLARTPVAIVGIAATLAAAGIAYQLFVQPSPEERKKRAADLGERKRRAAEKRALEKRWMNYGKGKE
jgi:hypothetical protein